MSIYNKCDERELFEQVKSSINQIGQQMPIVMDKQGRVIDGKVRMKACKALRIHPKLVRIDGTSKSVWKALNVDRRHLNVGQRALIAIDLANTRKGSNQHTAGAVSQADAAERCGVSADTIQRVRKALDLAREMGCEKKVREKLARNESPAQALRELEVRQVVKNNQTIARKNPKAAVKLGDLAKRRIKASVVYADPPWTYRTGTGTGTSKVAPERHYPTMPLDKINGMGDHIKEIAAKNSILWLWVPNSLVKDGFEVMEAWGFEYVTNMVWCKPRACLSPGAIKPQHEMLLIGKRGAGLAPQRNAHANSVVVTKGKKAHSEKPKEFSATIERLYSKAAKIELFARKQRTGWIAWGNQV